MNGLQVVCIKIRGDDGTRTERPVIAGPTPVPGLVINEDPQWAGTWNITHASSGAAVAMMFPDPEAALHVASRLGGVCDWTMTAAELVPVREEIEPRLVQALEDAHALGFQQWRGSVLSEIATGGAA